MLTYGGFLRGAPILRSNRAQDGCAQGLVRPDAELPPVQGIASQKDLFSGDPLNSVRKGPVFGMNSRDGRLTTYPSRVMRNTRLPPEAARLPAVPEDTRLGGMGTESSILSRDSSINSSSSRPWTWW